MRAAYAGETLLPRSVILEIARRVAAAKEKTDDRRMIEPLTPRELEVLRALTDGLSTPEICEKLYIAPNTLRTHVQNIMGKLRVHSKLEAVAFALKNRLATFLFASLLLTLGYYAYSNLTVEAFPDPTDTQV